MCMELRFGLMRSVTRQDFDALCDLLNARGHTTTTTTLLNRYGIHFLPGCNQAAGGRKDVRFSLMRTYDVESLDTVVFAHVDAPVYDPRNTMRARATALSDAEVRDVAECLVQAFGVVPNSIHNNGQLDPMMPPAPTLLGREAPDEVNMLLGFDLERAVAKWTVESESFPGCDDERLFACWKCGEGKPSQCFEPMGCPLWGHDDDDVQPFHQLLGNFECGAAPCCKFCQSELTTRKLAMRPVVGEAVGVPVGAVGVPVGQKRRRKSK
jgi:hypothetical protein